MWVRFIFRGRAYGAVKQPYRINAECRVRNNGGQTEYVCLWVTKVSVRTKILTSQVNTRKTRGTTYFRLPEIKSAGLSGKENSSDVLQRT